MAPSPREIERLARLALGVRGQLRTTEIPYLGRTLHVLVLGAGGRFHRPVVDDEGETRPACNVRWSRVGVGARGEHARPCRRCWPTNEAWFSWLDQQ